MITYELAKQLKDAGFPDPREPYQGEVGDIYTPTLEELIEACGDNFGCISKANSSESKRAWGNNEWHASFETIMGYIHGYGSTLEEAVARLWLELNKK